MTSGNYGVRRRSHPFARDGHDSPVAGAPGAVVGPYPGDSRRQDDGTYSLRLDPRLWPVNEDDLVTGPAGEVWIVAGLPQLQVNNLDPTLDHVTAAGVIQPELVP